MRLHSLSMTAFGPFRDEQVVDFDALSDAGLFLLTGRTGAGKTSLLDAVTYALYGQVPGVRSGALRVRSDHADPSVPTVVRLELTVRGVRVRVRRSPDWLRPRKRGDGSTRERGSVLLERQREGRWEFVSSRHDEVGDELGQLLGMTCEQFCQVVLLPQGEFASFLRADVEARKRLLERLFGTERFSAVEGWLGAFRVSRGEAYEQELSRRRDLVGRLAEVAGDTAPPDNEASDDDVLAWADSVLADIGQRRAAAHHEVQRAENAVREAGSTLDRTRQVETQQRLLRSLRERERRLLAAAAQRVADQGELTAATRAATLAPLLESVDEATEALAAATAAVEAGRTSVSKLRVDASGAAAALRGREVALRAVLTRLEDLLADACRLSEIDADLTLAQRRLTAGNAEALGHGTALAAAPAMREQLTIRLHRAEQATERLPHLDTGLAQAQARAAAAEFRDDLTSRRVTAGTAQSAAITAVQVARSRVLDLRERRLTGMAAELAAALRPGSPCPVCGSVDHPLLTLPVVAAAVKSSPVGGSGADGGLASMTQPVLHIEEQQAASALAAAESELSAADVEVRRLAEDHAVARVAAGGDESVAVLTAAAEELHQLRLDLARAARSRPSIEAQLTAFDAQVREHTAALRSVQAAILTDEARRDVLRVEHNDLEARLTAARDADPDVASRVRRLSAAADALATIAAALGDMQHARRACTTAEDRLDRAARAAGFAGAALAAVALRSVERIELLKGRIAAHDRESDLVAAGLAADGLHTVELRDAGDLASELERADVGATAAAATLRAAHGESSRLDGAHRRALQLHGDVVGAVSRLGPLRTAFTDADALAKLATGTGIDNRLRMRLSYYVLSARLEQVAAAASERLLRMSDGRFALRHTDERSGGNQRSGLGLLVCDSWYGTTRDPATLSGGESFMASLALALGLADVVVAEAGGQLMDTLFVDEGFGTLDDQTLDAVLDVLDGLRAGGRAVGLVSHVSELRDRIPAQLFVQKAHQGSTLQLSA